MSDPIDFITHNDIETLYAYTVAVLAIGVCAALAVANSSLGSKYRQVRIDLQAEQRNGRARDRELMQLRWENSVLVGTQLTAEQHLGLDTPANFNPGPPPAWAWEPLPDDVPDLAYPTPGDIAAMADQTAEVDMAAYLGEWRVPALAEGVPA
ncbi:MAG TPA: hypothetical protein VK611_24900 [Acidimicrobiales bacterium]|nr:hypothetical protein [Acidimicrobiales bacterium]